jgi:hypothetical protein
MRTNIKGDIGELLVMTHLLKKGFWVSKPFGDDCPYDVLCDNKLGEIKRVQVKFVTPKNGTLRCKLYSETGISYRNTVDWILLVDSVTENLYKIEPIKFDETTTSIHLRLQKSKNNQTLNINLAENFVF